MHRLLLLTPLLVLAIGCGSDPLPQGDPVEGERVAEQADPNCSVCHTLSSAGWTGKAAPNLDELALGYERVYEAISTGPGAMPSYDDQLSEQERHDIAAFVSAEVER